LPLEEELPAESETEPAPEQASEQVSTKPTPRAQNATPQNGTTAPKPRAPTPAEAIEDTSDLDVPARPSVPSTGKVPTAAFPREYLENPKDAPGDPDGIEFRK
jgi:hypothetical protein